MTNVAELVADWNRARRLKRIEDRILRRRGWVVYIVYRVKRDRRDGRSLWTLLGFIARMLWISYAEFAWEVAKSAIADIREGWREL